MYVPKPTDTSDVVLSDEVIKLTELIAKNTHENWAKNKTDEGWVYGESLDDKKKTHQAYIAYKHHFHDALLRNACRYHICMVHR